MGDEEEADGGWEWLPSDLLFLIFSTLPLSDLIRSALVCRRWRLSAADAHGHRPPPLPFLWSLHDQPAQLYSISDRRFYTLALPPEVEHSSVVDTVHEDWVGLLTCEDWFDDPYPLTYLLYNPFSGKLIPLPPIMPPVTPCLDGWFEIPPRVKFSCNPGEPGCQAAYFNRASGDEIGYYRLGDSTQSDWKMIPCDQWYGDIAFHNGLLYLVTSKGGLDVVDLVSMVTKKSLLPPPTVANCPIYLRLWTSLSEGVRRGGFRIFSVMDELLMVCVVKFVDGWEGGSPIAIYRADFELGRWEILENLKGQVLIMELTISLALSFRPDYRSFGLEGDNIYIMGEKHPVRLFRLSVQSCGTYNLIQNGYEDYREVYEFRNGDDEDELLYPESLRYISFHMLTLKPKFFFHI